MTRWCTKIDAFNKSAVFLEILQLVQQQQLLLHPFSGLFFRTTW